MELCLGYIWIGCLLRKSKFKMRIFEIQNPIFINSLFSTIFMTKLSSIFRIELSIICSKQYISFIITSWSFAGRYRLIIMSGYARGCILIWIISQYDIVSAITIYFFSPTTLSSIVCLMIASCEISQSISQIYINDSLVDRLDRLTRLLCILISVVG